MDQLEKFLKDKSDFQQKISTPEYHKFLLDNDLQFHLWDKMENVKFNPKIALKEMPLHWKAMILFNKQKGKYTFFKRKVYEYYFSGGDLEIESEIDIDEFLNKIEKLETDYEDYKLKMGIREQTIFIVIFIWVLVLLYLTNQSTFEIPNIVFNLIFLAPVLIIYYLSKHFYHKKKGKIARLKSQEFKSTLDYLKSELLKIKDIDS